MNVGGEANGTGAASGDRTSDGKFAHARESPLVAYLKNNKRKSSSAGSRSEVGTAVSGTEFTSSSMGGGAVPQKGGAWNTDAYVTEGEHRSSKRGKGYAGGGDFDYSQYGADFEKYDSVKRDYGDAAVARDETAAELANERDDMEILDSNEKRKKAKPTDKSYLGDVDWDYYEQKWSDTKKWVNDKWNGDEEGQDAEEQNHKRAQGQAEVQPTATAAEEEWDEDSGYYDGQGNWIDYTTGEVWAPPDYTQTVTNPASPLNPNHADGVVEEDEVDADEGDAEIDAIYDAA